MTQLEFIEMARRVNRYGHLVMCLTGCILIVLVSLLFIWVEPILRSGGQAVRQQLQNEGEAGLLFGLLVGLVSVPVLLVPIVPVWWLDRRLGVRCPHCGCSVTLRCLHGRVAQSGRCCKCQGVLFVPDASSGAEPVPADRDKH